MVVSTNSSLNELILTRSLEKPEQVAFRFLNDNLDTLEELSYQMLWEQAGKLAGAISRIAAPGARVLLLFHPGLAYVKAFYACLFAGVIAVPVYPPGRNSKASRIYNIVQNAKAGLALTDRGILSGIQQGIADCTSLQDELTLIDIESLTENYSGNIVARQPEKEQIAFLQYTSGSTGSPKGVKITFENIYANLDYLTTAGEGTTEDVFVNWLPTFHDMGLVTTILLPVWLRTSSTLMSPATFMRNPVNWLRAIGKFKATSSGAPNFAFQMCVDQIKQEHLQELDLSSWRVAYNAAEPIKAKTIAQFSEKFSAVGFRETAWFTSYGMAETTLLVSAGAVDMAPVINSYSRQELEQKRLIISTWDGETATPLVSCGQVLPPHYIKIIDPETRRELSDGEIGEVWISGPSVSPGYFNNAASSEVCFNLELSGDARKWFRSGDLGAVTGGELYITGRLKDLLILNGKNYYPDDIEDIAYHAHPALKAHACAAFISSINNQLAIVAEVKREHLRKIQGHEVAQEIVSAVFAELQIAPSRIMLIRPYSMPMTSSGKIKRNEVELLVRQNKLEIIFDSAAIFLDENNEAEREVITI